MEFLRTIKKSIYDRDFYETVKSLRFASALKHYTLFVLCIAFLVIIPLYISLFIASSHMKEYGDIRVLVLALYPDELILKFENGRVVSNVAEPYSIPMPKEFNVKQLQNLLVINTQGTVTPADFGLYDTSAILGGDAVWIYDREKDKIEIQKFDKFWNNSVVINKQKAGEWIERVWSIGKIVLTISVLFLPFLLFVFLWCSYLFYLILGAGIIFLIAKIRTVEMTYGQAYKIGLYLITLPILYNTVSIASLSMLRIPFGSTIILIIVTYLNLTPKSTSTEDKESGVVAKETEILEE
ncbi:MAG: DUF1189 domain-containing protein [Candidatus Moranbacteria bacterium]|nr:DUF1189 domain-containing protein [Candidatus Moranbacteria bacterium]OIQ04523.1 MAG: hypothetical protein AUK58_00115 [Candidatus Moranbacteria bacterium CG2_30_41_165]